MDAETYNTSMTQQPDVLILGGGVIGLTTAYFLSQEGIRVTILDRGQPAQESSWAGAGIISPAPAFEKARHPYEQLASLSVRLHGEMSQHLHASTGVSNEWVQSGGWELFEPNEPDPGPLWREQQVPFEEADTRMISQREPALRPGNHRTFFMPTMAQVRNPRHLRALLAWCERAGIVIVPNCAVQGFEKAGERITAVRTAQGSMSAKQYLLTAGAWSEGLLRELGWQPGIRPVRGQIALLNPGTRLLTRVVEVGKRYLVPRMDGHVLVGSTEEDVGFEKQTTAVGIEGLLSFAMELVPGLANAPLERCWAGLRPGSPDGMPFLGRVPGSDNLFIAAGHYRAGIMLSPATGLVMKQLLLVQPTSVPVETLGLNR